MLAFNNFTSKQNRQPALFILNSAHYIQNSNRHTTQFAEPAAVSWVFLSFNLRQSLKSWDLLYWPSGWNSALVFYCAPNKMDTVNQLGMAYWQNLGIMRCSLITIMVSILKTCLIKSDIVKNSKEYYRYTYLHGPIKRSNDYSSYWTSWDQGRANTQP